MANNIRSVDIQTSIQNLKEENAVKDAMLTENRKRIGENEQEKSRLKKTIDAQRRELTGARWSLWFHKLLIAAFFVIIAAYVNYVGPSEVFKTLWEPFHAWVVRTVWDPIYDWIFTNIPTPLSAEKFILKHGGEAADAGQNALAV